MEILKIVGKNLEKARGEMSRKELAKKAKVTYQHIYEIEEGLKNPSLKVLAKVAEALGINPAILFEDENKQLATIDSVHRFTKKILSIPDDVYNLAAKVKLNDPQWESVRAALEVAIEREQVEVSKK